MSDSALIHHDELIASLSAYLSTVMGRAVQVSSLTRMSNGWESDVFSFEAPLWREGGHVLRLYFGTDAGPKALGEYRALMFLASAGYPVPQVALVEPSADALGRSFLIMQRVEGEPLGKLWHHSDLAVREQALDRFCRLLASLHTLPWRHLPGAELVQSVSIAEQIASWSEVAERYPLDALKTGIAWLHAASSQVKRQPLGLVHWDFHHENILVNETGSASVIDWTQFQATDVRFDFAWTLVLLASERDPAIADQVRAGYMALRGWDEAVVQQELDVFVAAACLKRLVSVLVSMQHGADALGMRPGAETMMSSRLSRFALVYQQWLSLTATPLAEMEELLVEHL